MKDRTKDAQFIIIRSVQSLILFQQTLMLCMNYSSERGFFFFVTGFHIKMLKKRKIIQAKKF